MLYVKEEYKQYKYLVGISDNYIILTNQKSVNGTWQEPEEINVIYQYINNPNLVIEDLREISTSRTYQQVETSQNIMESTIWLDLTRTIIILAFAIIYLVNIPTKIVKKGGIFFGS